MTIPILSVKQPWAHAIVFGTPQGYKDVECRGWKTKHRGRLWIHAARRVEQNRHALSLAGDGLEDLPRGVIIGSVRVVDVVEEHPSRWATAGYFYWVLADPEPLPENEFVPVRGMPGLFKPPAEIAAQLHQEAG